MTVKHSLGTMNMRVASTGVPPARSGVLTPSGMRGRMGWSATGPARSTQVQCHQPCGGTMHIDSALESK